ncbi:hypothetical protein [Gilvimarinus algae]|uniref:PepSY domain-containing protein n=1 Tax=Gilvimarinus algae TaxID=3058037 RepID=A0ABT8TFW3_9GAMM|nr:hypothetical protein [Gilvimarinus sp. SDUM040014]MDO3381551.1 hypothetical protein [Gilvimarinus sp. SDUM040014]
MRVLIFCIVLSLGAAAAPKEIPSPTFSHEDILAAVLAKAGLEAADVTVTVFRYDYLQGLWHLELAPKEPVCIDCLPSFYIRNRTPLHVETIPHG